MRSRVEWDDVDSIEDNNNIMLRVKKLRKQTIVNANDLVKKIHHFLYEQQAPDYSSRGRVAEAD